MVKRCLLGLAILVLLLPGVTKEKQSIEQDIVVYGVVTKSIYLNVFKEPFEVMLVRFIQGDDLLITAGIWYWIPLTARDTERYIRECGREWEDVVIVIHNHLLPSRFSIGDVNFLRHARELGFKGHYLLYFPWSQKLWYYDENKRRTKELPRGTIDYK